MKRSLQMQRSLRGNEDRSSTMPTGAFVVSSDPRKGTVIWGGIRGRQESPVAHPYIGPTSWFRVSPERNTKIIVSYRGEDFRPYISSYVAEALETSSSSSLVDATESGKFYYRVLKEGEMHAVSTGLAEVTWQQNGTLGLRGGCTSIQLRDQDMVIQAIAPVHRQMGLGSKTQTIGNETRFGAVTRPSPLDSSVLIAPKVNNEYAKEYLRNTTLPGLQTPAVDIREGNVIEDNGTAAQLNGKNLRLRVKYGTTTGQSVIFTIDEQGNTSATIPQCDNGFIFKTVNADAKLDIGKNFNIVVSQNVIASARKFQYTADRIELAGQLRLATENFSSTLQGAQALATTPADTPTTVAIVAFLKLLPNGYLSACTTKTVAG